jgi:hypothetical protein
MLIGFAGWSVPAAAFPLVDPGNEASLPDNVTDLAAPDAQDLSHQLQLANGLSPPVGGGWTILPRITLEQVFDDNEQQVTRPRQSDLMSLVSPGIAIAGDLPRLQTKIDYAPTLEINVPAGSQNALVQQLNGTALVTIVPDLAFVDLRANAGVQAINGLVGANGAAGDVGQIGSAAGLSADSTTVGLPKAERTQTGNFAVSPYLMDKFGDYGTGKLGVSLTSTTSDQTNGFLTVPLPSGGVDGSSLIGLEETGDFTTGDISAKWQDEISFDVAQTRTTTNQLISAIGQTTAVPSQSTTSQRQTISDKVSYAANRWLGIFATFGHENIDYSTVGFSRIDDFTWSGGTTLTPNTDSSITLSYGHQNGFDSLRANVRYALTARTIITGGYTETLGTQLEQLGQQFQSAIIGPNGQLIDGSNGAPLIIPVYETQAVPQVFVDRTFNLNLATVLDRDTFNITAVLSQQDTARTGEQTNARVESANVQWTHALSPDILLSSYASYTLQSQGAGEICSVFVATSCTFQPGGSEQSLVFGVSLNYTLTDTVTANLRYLFNDRISSVANQSMYQDLLIVGITKQF